MDTRRLLTRLGIEWPREYRRGMGIARRYAVMAIGFLLAATVATCAGSDRAPTQPPFERFFFSASDVRGVLEVQTSPPSICYETQSFPARPIEIVSNPFVGPVKVVASYSPERGTYCDRSVGEALTRDIIDHPSGYTIAWRPDRLADTTISRLTPQ